MKNKPLFIVFTGSDGSGKTTQAKNLVRWLKEQGIEASYKWNRFQPYLTYYAQSAVKRLMVGNRKSSSNHDQYNATRGWMIRNKVSSFLLTYEYLIEYIIFTWWTVAIPLKLKHNLVCDRYVFDTIISLAADMSLSDRRLRRLLGGCLHLLPLPQVTLLIDVPEEVACGRKDDILSRERLTKLRTSYLNISKECGMIILDGTASPEEVGAQVQEIVGKELE